MRDLAHGPSLGTVGRVQLLLREPFHGCAQAARCLLDVVEELLSLFRPPG
jgi:hypothetical protein